jgi:hypothetical protein
MNYKSRAVRRLRNAAVILGTSGALVVGAAGIAQASQVSTLSPGQSRSFSTWFWGRTEVCFQNVSSQVDAYYWSSGWSTGGGVLAPGAESCITRSFVGLLLNVQDWGQGPLQVTFPIGP